MKSNKIIGKIYKFSNSEKDKPFIGKLIRIAKLSYIAENGRHYKEISDI